MFSYRIALAACLAPFFVFACSAEGVDESSSAESEVRASASCPASLVTFEGTAEAGLRADLRAALGQAANDDAVSMPGVLRVSTENGKDAVTFFQSSWKLEEGAFNFPGDTFDNVASKVLYDAMSKAKETYESDGEIVVRTSPKGRVVCRLYVGLSDPDSSAYVCAIAGLEGKAPAAKPCSETITFEAKGPGGLRGDLLTAVGGSTSDKEALVAGGLTIDESDTVQLFGTSWRYATDPLNRPTLLFPAATSDSDAAAKKVFDAMTKASESKDGDDVMRTSKDGFLQCGAYKAGSKSTYLCEVRKWPAQ